MTILGRPRRPVPVPEDQAEAAGEPTPPHPPPPAPPPPAVAGRRRSRWALVAVASVAAVAVVAALLGLQQRNALQADRTLDRELRDVSGRTVAALTTYDYQHLDQWRQAVMANLTGSFSNTFRTSLSQGYEQVYVASHNRGTSTVEGVWVGQASGGQATTVVLVRITVTSLTGTHTIEPYVQLTLLNVGGRWRVDDVRYTIESATGSPGTTPSPTTSVP